MGLLLLPVLSVPVQPVIVLPAGEAEVKLKARRAERKDDEENDPESDPGLRVFRGEPVEGDGKAGEECPEGQSENHQPPAVGQLFDDKVGEGGDLHGGRHHTHQQQGKQDGEGGGLLLIKELEKQVKAHGSGVNEGGALLEGGSHLKKFFHI